MCCTVLYLNLKSGWIFTPFCILWEELLIWMFRGEKSHQREECEEFFESRKQTEKKERRHMKKAWGVFPSPRHFHKTFAAESLPRKEDFFFSIVKKAKKCSRENYSEKRSRWNCGIATTLNQSPIRRTQKLENFQYYKLKLNSNFQVNELASDWSIFIATMRENSCHQWWKNDRPTRAFSRCHFVSLSRDQKRGTGLCLFDLY